MADMLVKLYELPELAPVLKKLQAVGIEIRAGHASEKDFVADWVARHFKPNWGVACQITLLAKPITCFIALEKSANPEPPKHPYDLPPERLVGFACYDVAALGVFGPTGVRQEYRERGIGKGLLLASLHAMRVQGYQYAVIGQVGPTEFYRKTVGATIIEGSEPGFVRGRLVE